ncbi:MAG TPA: hypothetical protein VFX28_00640 [Methylomirabilota bacterium]|nr:hypothetical protein [Methylomirabilota bacterium]
MKGISFTLTEDEHRRLSALNDLSAEARDCLKRAADTRGRARPTPGRGAVFLKPSALYPLRCPPAAATELEARCRALGLDSAAQQIKTALAKHRA